MTPRARGFRSTSRRGRRTLRDPRSRSPMTAPPASALPPTADGLPPRGTVALLALAAGATVANLYYSQPLLADVARDLHTGPTRVSAVITATQSGYAAGLLLLVPLGDRLERR